VTDSYTYDAFGAMTSHTGTNPQPFMYTGQQQDVGAARSLVYLRARSYDPALGRFVSKDPVSFNQRYSYVGNDPANRVDPTGLLGWKSVIHVGSAVVDTATAAGAGAVAAVSDCARSHTCTSTVATIGLVAGSVTGQPWLIGASIGVLAASDSASCAQGNKVSCALAAADVVTIGATGLRAYGYAGAVVVGDLTPAEAMLQLTSAEIFNDTYRLALSSRAGVSLALLGFVFDGGKERP
jgi:RHS repeat-associated protein